MHARKAINYFLQHSFNLNPAIISAVELAMADHPITTNSNVQEEAKTNSNASGGPEMAEETKTGAGPDEPSEVGSGNGTAKVEDEGNDGGNDPALGGDSRGRATGAEGRFTDVAAEAKSNM